MSPAVLAVALTLFGVDDPPLIPAEEAASHVGKRVTVELTVVASKDGTNRRTYFLDSKDDYRADDAFTVIISYDDAPKFAAAGIEKPSDFYFEKTIRVTGTVIVDEDQIRIRATSPEQIRVVEPVD
jgi:hypothetical protein